MQCEWRYRRDTYYAMNPMEEQTDALGENVGDYINEGTQYKTRYSKVNIIGDALDYLFGSPKELVYPAKSYAIATLYAYHLSLEFGDSLLDFLIQEDLLPGDPHFLPCRENNYEIYKELALELEIVLESGQKLGPWGQKTYEYFLQKFMLDESGKAILPRG